MLKFGIFAKSEL